MSKPIPATVSAAGEKAGSSSLRRLPMPANLWVPCASESELIGKHVRRGEALGALPRDGAGNSVGSALRTTDLGREETVRSANPTKTERGELGLNIAQSLAPADGIIEGFSIETILGGAKTSMAILKTESPDSKTSEPATNAESARKTLKELTAGALAKGIEKLIAAGVNAHRWTSPDLLGQLHMVASGRCKTVLCSALDLDPALPVQRVLASENAMDIAVGAAALGKLCNAGQVFLAVPEDMASAGVAALKAAAVATGIKLYPLPNEYPLAHPSLLIQRITGKRLKPNKSPAEVGVVMLDAPAAIAVGRCFVHDEPMLRLPFGVYDREHAKAFLVLAPIGMKIADVLAALDISQGFRELRFGHVLREMPAERDAIVGGAELTIFAAIPHSVPAVSACLRCGWCVEACPVYIHPAGLLEAAQQHDQQIAEHNGIRSCIECGICSYVCPSRLPLLTAIRGLRTPA